VVVVVVGVVVVSVWVTVVVEVGAVPVSVFVVAVVVEGAVALVVDGPVLLVVADAVAVLLLICSVTLLAMLWPVPEPHPAITMAIRPMSAN